MTNDASANSITVFERGSDGMLEPRDTVSTGGLAPAQMVALIDEFEALGHVERSRDPADRRRTRVTITARGRKALASGDEVAAVVEREVFGTHASEGARCTAARARAPARRRRRLPLTSPPDPVVPYKCRTV